MDEVSALYDKYTDMGEEEVPLKFARFIDYSQRRTTDTEPRRERAKFVLETVGQ